MKEKLSHPINVQIPIETWRKFEKLYLKVKNGSDRNSKLRKKEFIVRVIKKGISQWNNI